MELIIICIAIFIAILLAGGGGWFLLRRRFDPESRRIRKKISELSRGSKEGSYGGEIDITKKRRHLSNIPWLNRLLWSIPLLHRIDSVLLQSAVKQSLGLFIFISCILAFTGFLFSQFLTKSSMVSVLIAACLSMIPFGFIFMKKEQRVKKFEKQLPDALDLIARSLRAGHAFIGGLQMVGEEFEDPIGTEFTTVIEEIGFGVGVKEALTTMTERVSCSDLKFVVVSLSVQQETGGNLCEILEKISYLIRERFKLLGRVRTLSAEGKLSAIILVAIPIFVGLAIWVLNPEHLKPLWYTPTGNILLAASFMLMAVGIIAMRKIIKIKV